MRTLLISLGGARYASAPHLAHEAFSPSSNTLGSFLLEAGGGIVSPDDWLNLFDDDRSWPDQLIWARNWLKERSLVGISPSNIIVHYVGHGWFRPNSEDHLLTINHTDLEEKVATSATLSSLNAMLQRQSRGMRRYYLIDACFAAASARDLMADHHEAIERQVGQVLQAWPEEGGTSGVAALCSADKSSTASARGCNSLTQFTDGLITVLKQGDAAGADRLSLRKIFDLLRSVLNTTYGERMVHPVLVAPNDAAGGIAGVPVFVNAAWKGSTATRVSTVASAVEGPLRADVSGRSVDKVCAVDLETVGLTEPGEGFGRSVPPACGDNLRKDLDVALNKEPNFQMTMYRFFRLAPSQKQQIVKSLGLRQHGDSLMTELDGFKAALKRARANGKISNLEILMDEAEARK